ncbi:MAG: hypothetical protein IID05_04550 [Gemmatimonadetes bacterium]|nr:hypothetical protein [Gemmatimonadota bacterium]
MTSSFGSAGNLRSLHQLLEGQRGRLAELQDIHLAPTEEPWQTLLGYPFCLRDSIESFLILAPLNRMRDCYVIARTVLETSVTYCYIAALGPEGAERAWRHAHQKAYRDLSRELKIGKTTLRAELSHRARVEDLPADVRTALDEYTNRRGGEIRDWTSDNLVRQLEIIQERFGTEVASNLIFPQFAIFRHSSEIAHGSLFGTLWPLGLLDATGKPATPDDLAERFGEHLAMLYMMLALCVDAVLHVANTGFCLAELVAASSDAIKQLRDEPWAQEGAV